jgi:broad specificity phosphatase PhoE
MEIYAIRHAQSTYNKWAFKRIYTPWLWTTSDPMIQDAPLSEKGLIQARKLHHSIRELREKVQLIICSPLTRAIHTMQIAFPDANCHIIISPLVRERGDKLCDMGTPLPLLQEKYPQYEFLHFNSDIWWSCQPEPPHDFIKETRESLQARQRELIEFLKTRAEEVVVIVSHGQFIKTLAGKRMQIGNCGIKKFALNEL